MFWASSARESRRGCRVQLRRAERARVERRVAADLLHCASGHRPFLGEPPGEIGTNECRALTTNWLSGHIWAEFSSDEKRALGAGFYRDVRLDPGRAVRERPRATVGVELAHVGALREELRQARDYAHQAAVHVRRRRARPAGDLEPCLLRAELEHRDGTPAKDARPEPLQPGVNGPRAGPDVRGQLDERPDDGLLNPVVVSRPNSVTWAGGISRASSAR